MSELITQFHFLRPVAFLLLIPAIVLAVLLLRQHLSAVQWQTLISPHLLPYLVDKQSQNLSRLPIYLLLVLWLLVISALAGPTWQQIPQAIEKQTSALVIAWDLSPSMLAEDIKPSRLVRARLKLTELLKQRKEGLTALVAYSGEAHIVTPLTDDTETIISLLGGLDPNIMPSKGSNTEMALELANKLLKDGGVPQGDILFLTDGIAENAHEHLMQLNDNTAHTVSVWGIGTAEGAPIPLANGGFAYSSNGAMVVAQLDDSALSDIATKLGGVYIPFTTTEFDLQTIQNFVFNIDVQQTETANRLFDQWYEQGPLLLLLVIPFAAFAFRRGWLLSVAFIVVSFSATESAEALDWKDLWQTSDQQAQKLFTEDPKAAAEKFEDSEWKAVANYEAKEFEAALENFSGESLESQYNRANTLTQLAKYQEAIAAYREILQEKPDFSEAEDNLKIAEQLKDLAEQQNQDNDQGESGEDGEQSDDSGQANQSQSENGSQSSNEDSQQQDGEESNQQSQQNQQANEDASKDQEQQGQGESSELSDEQKQAMEETYGKTENEQQDEPQASDENDSESQLQEQEQEQEQEQKQASASDAETDPSNPIVMRGADLNPEQQELSEADQSMQQWLRKVPDDPSGLLRNKFNYEYRQRKRALNSRQWTTPEGEQDDERW